MKNSFQSFRFGRCEKWPLADHRVFKILEVERTFGKSFIFTMIVSFSPDSLGIWDSAPPTICDMKTHFVDALMALQKGNIEAKSMNYKQK